MSATSPSHAQLRLHKHTSKAIHQHAQICLPSHLRVVFLVLLISVLPNTYSGACAHPQSRLTLTRSLPHVNRNIPTAICSPNPENSPLHMNIHTYTLQHSRQHLERSLKSPLTRPLTHATKFPPKQGCSNGPRGPVGECDVSSLGEMRHMFSDANQWVLFYLPFGGGNNLP